MRAWISTDAAREPLSARQLAGVLDREPFAVEQDLEPLAAFFPERDGVYPVFHKSIADWLGGEAGRSRAFRVDVAAGHHRIAAHLLNLWQAGDRDRFTLAHLPAHLAAAAQPQALQELLADYRFLEAKLPVCGPQSLIDDYALAAEHAAGEAAESLRLIGDALRLRPRAGGEPGAVALSISGPVADLPATAGAGTVGLGPAE